MVRRQPSQLLLQWPEETDAIRSILTLHLVAYPGYQLKCIPLTLLRTLPRHHRILR
jgi:hypothetical protein